jgi:hypothetical protein
MTLFWQPGARIKVNTDAMAIPQTIIWQGKVHVVASIAQRWRVDTGWWRWRIWREYWKLTTHSGLLLVMYRDVLHGDWYLQRLYD